LNVLGVNQRARVCASDTRHTVKRETIGRWILAGVCYGDTAYVGVTFDTRALRTHGAGVAKTLHVSLAQARPHTVGRCHHFGKNTQLTAFSSGRNTFGSDHCRLWFLPHLHVSITSTFYPMCWLHIRDTRLILRTGGPVVLWQTEIEALHSVDLLQCLPP
jgi:hypothetical protein